jgi:hypothetical protein
MSRMTRQRFVLALGAGLLIPALVLSGCSKKKSSDSTSSAQPTQSSSSAQPTQRPAATSASGGSGSNASNSELAALVANFLKAKSFRITLQDSRGTPQGTVEYVAPDKYHINVAGFEEISIGKDVYVKQGTTWAKLPSSQGVPSIFNADTFKSQLDQLSTTKFTKGGTDNVNGTSCQIYNVTNADGTTSEICVANGLPVRVKAGDTIILISDYDKVGDIKAPI